MLDLLRRNASSWLIKAPIAAIIISFAFFFGYSAMRSGPEDESEQAVALVNGMPVSAAEYAYFLDNNIERLRQNFDGAEIPAFAEQMAKSTTLRQVVSREAMLQETDKLGIVIPNSELADIIKEIQKNMQGGEFDPMFYRYRFLPHFKNRYGLDYEGFVRRDLKLDAFRNLFRDVDSSPIFSPGDQGFADGNTWTFEVIEITPDKLVEKKIIEKEEDARNIAEDLIKTPPNKWNAKLKRLNLEAKKTDPLTLSRRRGIMGEGVSVEILSEIFKLDKENPVLNSPVEHNGRLYVVRLVDRSNKDDIPAPAAQDDGFFRAWMSKMLAKAKVESFIDDEGQ